LFPLGNAFIVWQGSFRNELPVGYWVKFAGRISLKFSVALSAGSSTQTIHWLVEKMCRPAVDPEKIDAISSVCRESRPSISCGRVVLDGKDTLSRWSRTEKLERCFASVRVDGEFAAVEFCLE
jgi:hypothetical protein